MNKSQSRMLAYYAKSTEAFSDSESGSLSLTPDK